MLHKAPVERGTDFSPVQPVLVSLRGSVITGMKSGSGFLSAQDSDGGRQKTVQGAAEVFNGDGIGDGKRGHLGFGMHARIGSARSVDHHGLALDPADDFLQLALNGGQAGLHLPAMEVRAFVGDGETDTARLALG